MARGCSTLQPTFNKCDTNKYGQFKSDKYCYCKKSYCNNSTKNLPNIYCLGKLNQKNNLRNILLLQKGMQERACAMCSQFLFLSLFYKIYFLFHFDFLIFIIIDILPKLLPLSLSSARLQWLPLYH